jgi:RNA polymerase sigma-70 factor (ECF subfamily)
MAENPNEAFEAQDPLEQLLDEESDEEFGLPEFKEHLADSLTPAVLKDWTAADFASIYVRFRPHLERHAKRFLVNPSQVEEVVQDAFLYLMTTLPELDSELGVLKFLKWKTRLLALDVIRANSRASFAPIDEQPEIAAKVDEFSLELERADDAAIVALALAKLQPRHREALIATLYEEKSNEVVAAQMGLNENAFRQLLFRARSAFKKALVGEAETSGMRASEILSLAARKAARESGKYISAAGAFLLVVAISVGVLPNLSQPAQEQIAAPVPAVTSSEAPVTQEQPTESENQLEPAPQDEVTEVLVEGVESTSVQQVQLASSQVAGATTVAAASVEDAGDSAVETDSERLVLESFLMDTLNGDAIKSLSRNTSGQVVSNAQGLLTLSNGSGLTANVAYNLNTEQGIQYTWFSLDVDGLEFAAVPQVWHSQKTTIADGGTLLSYIATDLLIGDTAGNFRYIASDDTAVSTGAVRMEILISKSGQVLSSSLYLTARS